MAFRLSSEACKLAVEALREQPQLLCYYDEIRSLLATFTMAVQEETKIKSRYQDLISRRRQTEDHLREFQDDELGYAMRANELLKSNAEVSAAKREHEMRNTQAQNTAKNLIDTVRDCLILANAYLSPEVWQYIIDSTDGGSGKGTGTNVIHKDGSQPEAEAFPLSSTYYPNTGLAEYEPDLGATESSGIHDNTQPSCENTDVTANSIQKSAADAKAEFNLSHDNSAKTYQGTSNTCPGSSLSDLSGDTDEMLACLSELGETSSVYEASDNDNDDYDSESLPMAKIGARRKTQGHTPRAGKLLSRAERLEVQSSLDQERKRIDEARQPAISSPNHPRWAVISENLANIWPHRRIERNDPGEYMHMIVRHEGRFYILRCDICRAHMGSSPWHDMQRHVCQCWSAGYWNEPHMKEHKALYAMAGTRFNGSLLDEDNLIKIFGVEIPDCNYDKMVENNRAFRAKVLKKQKNLEGTYVIMSGPYARDPRRKPTKDDFGLKKPFETRQDCINYMERMSNSKRNTPSGFQPSRVSAPATKETPFQAPRTVECRELEIDQS